MVVAQPWSSVPIGATRNLTAQFIKYRNEARKSRGLAASDVQSDSATASLLKGADNSSDVEHGRPSRSPQWVAKAEKLRVDMSVLKERLVKLREYHNKSLLVTFGADDVSTSHAEALTREIQETFKRLYKEIDMLDKGPATPEEDPDVRKQVQQHLAKALFQLSVEFRQEETRYLNRVEQQKGLEQGSTLGLIEDEAKTTAEAVDPGFTQAQLALVEQSTALIEERDEQIRQIVDSIADLAQIMRDLATLVVEQGTVLDRIDHNIQQTAFKVEEGVKQLVAAESTQKNSRMFMCILALIVLIVLMLIILLIRHH